MSRPILEYGAQVLLYNDYFLNRTVDRTTSLNNSIDILKKIENFQTLALKYLLGYPKLSSPAIVRLLSYVEPMSS